MAIRTTNTVLLENTTGGSDKFYEIKIIHEIGVYVRDSTHKVVCRYGRRSIRNWQKRGGSTINKDEDVYNTNYNADRRLRDIVRSKKAKGYVEVELKKVPKPKKPGKSKKVLDDPTLERFRILDI